MSHFEKIVENSDSIIELLAAQCGDLEKLLTLAREETSATEQGNFEQVFDIVYRRAEISQRLETSQQQIAELREHLGASASAAINNDIARQVVATANLIMAQDRETKLLLTAARDEAAQGLANLEKSQRGANAYLREETRGLSYNQSF